MRSRLSAAYKGIHALLMSKGARDLRSGDPIDDTVFWDESVDIHHVFPKDWCKKSKIEPKVYDAVVNKTPLTQKTNRIIGAEAPSVYLKKLVAKGSTDSNKLDEHLKSHLIDPVLLRNDDFEAFYRARKSALLELVFEAMGKSTEAGADVDEEDGEEVLEPEDALELAI